jgi:membrane-associated HD superfamily phosphohydrolase
MKETFYFSHDYNPRSDTKIKRLLSRHGMMGYGIYWSIIEDLYNNTNVLQTDYECIAFDLRTDAEVIRSIINDFDLFTVQEKTFGSPSVQRRLNERDSKSQKARESVQKRWKNEKNNTNVLPNNYAPNTIKESKVKEMKVKESKVNNILLKKESKYSASEFLISNGAEPELVTDWLSVRKTKKLATTATAMKDFIREVQKNGLKINEVLKICIIKGWGGFSHSWLEKDHKPKKETGTEVLNPTQIPNNYGW